MVYVIGIVENEDIATTKRETARRKKSCRFFFVKGDKWFSVCKSLFLTTIRIEFFIPLLKEFR